MRIVFAGSGDFAVPSLRKLINSEHQIALVITQPDRATGRGRRAAPTPVRAAAQEHGLDVLAVENVNAGEASSQILACGARLAVVIAFGQKIGRDLLDGLPAGWINLHASLLPAYRGAAPIHRAILDGCDETGVTVFRLVERMDAGNILVQRRTLIKPEETTAELHDRLAGIGCDAIDAALRLFAEGVPQGHPQDESRVTIAKKLRKEDGRVDFTQPADVVARHVCGMWSWPGASCQYTSADGRRSERVILARARKAEAPAEPLPSGSIDQRLYVTTGEGCLELLEIKPESGRLMTWQEFVNGRHVQPGDRFESTA